MRSEKVREKESYEHRRSFDIIELFNQKKELLDQMNFKGFEKKLGMLSILFCFALLRFFSVHFILFHFLDLQ